MRIQNVTTNYQNNKQKFGMAIKGQSGSVTQLVDYMGLKLFPVNSALTTLSSKKFNIIGPKLALELMDKNQGKFMMPSDMTEIFAAPVKAGKLSKSKAGNRKALETVETVLADAVELIPTRVSAVIREFDLARDCSSPLGNRLAALSELGIKVNAKSDLK